MMLAARGAFLAARRKPKLPYDAEVEYLRSTGVQRIDTGMPPPALYTGYQVEIEYRYTSRPSNDTWVFGYWNNNPSARLYLIGYYNGYRCGAGPDNSGYWATIGYDTNFHVAQILNDGAYFDGVKLKPTDLSRLAYQSRDEGFWLFRSRHIDTGGVRQVKYCKMWTISGELVRDFIPVRFTNELGQSEGAMYDRANPTVGMDPDGSPRTDGLYRNRGTGAFVNGPDKTA